MTFTARVDAVEPGARRKYRVRFSMLKDEKALETFEAEHDAWVQIRDAAKNRLQELRTRYELADAARLWVGQVITEA